MTLYPMRHLNLVKSLSRLQEEQKYTDEILLDAFGLGLTRGTLVEIAGFPSSGKTSLSLALLAKLTHEGEICAVVDSCDSFDPRSAVLAGVKQENLLWVRCGGRLEKAFMAADYLVQAKGFGAIWLNLCGLPQKQLRAVPRTYWYRYRTRIKDTPTVLIATAAESIAGSASQRSFTFARQRTVWSGTGRYKLLREFYLKCNSKNDAGLRIADCGMRSAEIMDKKQPTNILQFAWNGHELKTGATKIQDQRSKIKDQSRLIKIEFDYTDV